MNRKNLIILSALLAGLGTASITGDAIAGKATDPEKFWRSPGTIHGKTVVIPMGSHFEGRMNETISSKTRQGQKFSIEITSPVLANSTDVVIPIGSKIIGEVVEAIPSSKQPRTKNKFNQKNPKPFGKLRTQLSTLETPDGMTHPLVATIMHDYVKNGAYNRPNSELTNPSMGYVGSQSSFDAVHPGFDTRPGSSHGPKVTGRREFMRDPILGNEGRNKAVQYGTPVIRSIQKKGNEICILSGSPLTVRLDAPLKMGIAPSKGSLSIDLDPTTPSLDEGANNGSFRRFQPVSRKAQEEERPQQIAPPQAAAPPPQPSEPDPEDGLPAFLRKKKSYMAPPGGQPPLFQQGAPQQGEQGGVPVQPSQKPGEAF